MGLDSKKITIKKSCSMTTQCVIFDFARSHCIFLLNSIQESFFATLTVRSLYTFNVCGFVCCAGMHVILPTVHVQCTEQQHGLRKKIQPVFGTMWLIYFCVDAAVNTHTHPLFSFFLFVTLLRFFWFNFEQKLLILHGEIAVYQFGSDHWNFAFGRFAHLQNTHRTRKWGWFLNWGDSWIEYYSTCECVYKLWVCQIVTVHVHR